MEQIELLRGVHCVLRSKRRQSVLKVLCGSGTAAIVGKRIGLLSECASDVLRELKTLGLAECINEGATSNRVYKLTRLGRECLESIGGGLADQEKSSDRVWELFAKANHRHRRAIVKSLEGRLRQPEVRKRATSLDDTLKMGDSNARRALHALEKEGMVQRSYEKKQSYPYYELTSEGRNVRDLFYREDAV